MLYSHFLKTKIELRLILQTLYKYEYLNDFTLSHRYYLLDNTNTF